MDRSSWPAGIRPSGKGIRIKIWRGGRLAWSETVNGDPYSSRDLSAAVRRREELISRLRLGLPLYAGDETADTQLFSEAAQEYMNTLDAKHSTHLSYENLLNRYWIPEFGHWPVHEITATAIKGALASHQVTAKTKKNALIPLRGVLDHAGLAPNPASGIRFRRRQTNPVQRYTPQERSALLKNLSGQELVYFAVLFGCGLRPGEALALRWTDYDGEELDISKQITRRRHEPSTKTSQRRRVYVPKWVRPFLKQHVTRFAGEYVFVNSKGGPYLDTDVFNGAWQKAHKKARIPYRIPYTCRHTRAAELLSLGIDPADAAKQMGHSPEMFLRIYSEWIEEYSRNKDKSRFEGAGVELRKTETDKQPTKRAR
ncbi:MAG: site-specific integrase [Pseudohongiellaceae bacterium]